MSRVSQPRVLIVPSFIAGIALVVLLALLRGHVHLHQAHAAVPGDQFPSLSLTDLNGARQQISARNGVTVYNVFATWCPPCRAETPAFAQAAKALQARGIRVVGIDQGDPPASVRAFVEQYGLNYQVFIDDGHLTNELLGARVIPETIVTRNGVLQMVYVGPLDDASLAQLVRSLV